MNSGKDYHELKPVIAIWLLADNLFKDKTTTHHCFQVIDLKQNKLLNDHCAIHLLELQKWQERSIMTNKDQWALFFRNAQYWHSLPTELNLPELREAMAILRRFSEKERDYHLYQTRENAIREQKSRQRALEEALADREAAVKEQQRLREMLIEAGINPDTGESS